MLRSSSAGKRRPRRRSGGRSKTSAITPSTTLRVCATLLPKWTRSIAATSSLKAALKRTAPVHPGTPRHASVTLRSTTLLVNCPPPRPALGRLRGHHAAVAKRVPPTRSARVPQSRRRQSGVGRTVTAVMVLLAVASAASHHFVSCAVPPCAVCRASSHGRARGRCWEIEPPPMAVEARPPPPFATPQPLCES